MCRSAGIGRKIPVGIIVGIEYRHLGHARLALPGSQMVKEPGLGLLVPLQAAVNIEVLVGDVGDDSQVEITGGYAVLLQSVGCDLEHGYVHPGSDHLGEVTLHVGGIWRGGMQAGVHLALADDGVDGGDQAGAPARGDQDAVQQVAGGGLAIGAGYAHDRELARGKPVPGRREVGQSLAAIGHDHQGDAQTLQTLFGDDGNRAVGHGLRDKVVPIDRDAAIGDKEAAGCHLARVAR